MTRQEFLKEFAATAELTVTDAKKYAEIIEDIIDAHMKDEGGVKPFKGISFKASYKQPYTGRNPQTGEPMEIAGRWQPSAKFGKSVKDAIQE